MGKTWHRELVYPNMKVSEIIIITGVAIAIALLGIVVSVHYCVAAWAIIAGIISLLVFFSHFSRNAFYFEVKDDGILIMNMLMSQRFLLPIFVPGIVKIKYSNISFIDRNFLTDPETVYHVDGRVLTADKMYYHNFEKITLNRIVYKHKGRAKKIDKHTLKRLFNSLGKIDDDFFKFRQNIARLKQQKRYENLSVAPFSKNLLFYKNGDLIFLVRSPINRTGVALFPIYTNSPRRVLNIIRKRMNN